MRSPRTLAAALLLIVTLTTPAGARTATVDCSEAELPVSVGLLTQTVRGQLCRPAGTTPGTVQLLVHGATYSSRYWDFPFDGHRYSYQRDLATRGIATFAFDAIGSGRSDHPLSVLVTGVAQASVVHQLVGKLRSGHVLGRRFERVVLVGHSMGSGLAVVAAATYRDVDGVVLTGYSHAVNMVEFVRIFAQGIRPAALDPTLVRRGTDPGYITTAAGQRRVFHDPGVVDPAVVDADEDTKDQVPATIVPDLFPLAFVSPLSRQIDVPVLLVNGAADRIFCAAVCADRARLLDAERPYFAPTTPVDAYLLPNAGHTLGYAPNAADYRTAVAEWMSARFGE
ncbi:alpha/beta hydrolase [Saccharothrix obliqua]|uniref:alpha/beta hydrolase n=1 Tax=Saccharothrix obliqua TaxID=2861747 RepID=UPI001C5EEF2D|nr:alpha/beta fold hydrolase [Saccharothrix obliqua]MBW4718435.1 lysophospholipase [Saccharothrix obliqua]